MWSFDKVKLTSSHTPGLPAIGDVEVAKAGLVSVLEERMVGRDKVITATGSQQDRLWTGSRRHVILSQLQFMFL